jgi:aryl-alcohol dehydrogenase-like predicted oxidoreductase
MEAAADRNFRQVCKYVGHGIGREGDDDVEVRRSARLTAIRSGYAEGAHACLRTVFRPNPPHGRRERRWTGCARGSKIGGLKPIIAPRIFPMSDLPTSTLGRTGATVTKLAYGAMELRGPRPDVGGREVTPDQAKTILNAVLDAGITLIDTSPDYGGSEAYIGEFIAHRRDEYFLSSKCGCAVNPPAGERPGHVYTRENVRAGVEQSLRRMKTDRIDLVQFHISPSRAELEANDSVAELVELQREGKIRFLGMSGVLPNLTDHIAMGVFDAFQIPYSALEREHEGAIHDAAVAGAGTIVRGGVARGVPVARPESLERLPERFRATYAKRRDLWDDSGLDVVADGMPRMEFMLRFTLSHPDMTTTIVGTLNPAHLDDNLAAARKGVLPADQYAEAKRRLDEATRPAAVA